MKKTKKEINKQRNDSRFAKALLQTTHKLNRLWESKTESSMI